jgi:hypothetical protein
MPNKLLPSHLLIDTLEADRQAGKLTPEALYSKLESPRKRYVFVPRAVEADDNPPANEG